MVQRLRALHHIRHILTQHLVAGLLLVAKTSMSSIRHHLTTFTAKATWVVSLIRVLSGIQTTALSCTQDSNRRSGRPSRLVLSDKSVEQVQFYVSVKSIILSKIGAKARLVGVNPTIMHLDTTTL